MFPISWDDALNELKEDLKSEWNTLELEDILSNTTIPLKVWKILLLTNLIKADEGLLSEEYSNISSLIYENTSILEHFLCSGDVPSNRWVYAFNKLCEILNSDTEIMNLPEYEQKNSWQLRLAVATALTFSSPVRSFADDSVVIKGIKRFSEDYIKIDGLRRYNTFSNLANMPDTPLFSGFDKLSSWHFRYVVGSWARDEELEWARENVPKKFANPMKIGRAAKMVTYRSHNCKEISVFGCYFPCLCWNISVQSDDYYNNHPVTLQVMHEVGGVCGAVSKFATGMCQAHGIPAMPVGQPEHCAFLWLKGEKWTWGNKLGSLKNTTVHSGIQFPWCTDKACYVFLMNDAQYDFINYKLSEMMRVIACVIDDSPKSMILLKHATSRCPANFPAWKDLINNLGHLSNDEAREMLYSKLEQELSKYPEIQRTLKTYLA